MNAEAPDPSTFKSWDDAFRYPVPVVRKLEAQLRSGASEHSEKLRSLVGASFRDLLGTAERIIAMDGEMQRAETKLNRIGRNCNSRVVAGRERNVKTFDRGIARNTADKYCVASQLAVLRSCHAIVAKVLRKGGSMFLAAKILVIARLLLKSMEQTYEMVDYVAELKRQLALLRSKLLSRMDKRMCEANAAPPDLVQIMAAFALITTSTPSDVLQYFQSVRLYAINAIFDSDRPALRKGSDALRLCTDTYKASQAIFPKALASALARLKTLPLVDDAEIRAETELNLDIYKFWMTEEVRVYTPYRRHDDLSQESAERLQRQWAKESISLLLTKIENVLKNFTELRDVISLREEVLRTWLNNASRIPEVDVGEILDKFRQMINTRSIEIIKTKTNEFERVTESFSEISIDSSHSDSSLHSFLWNYRTTVPDTESGASNFKKTILKGVIGDNVALMNSMSAYDLWSKGVADILTVIGQMKSFDWNDGIIDEEADDIDMDLDFASLSRDDPHAFSDALNDALFNCFKNGRKAVGRIIGGIGSKDSRIAASRAVFLVRAIREVGQRFRTLQKHHFGTLKTLSPFDSSLVDPLHVIISNHVLDATVGTFEASLGKHVRSKKCFARSLWEGKPPLPSQPSSSMIQLLKNLSLRMAETGPDLWTTTALATFREIARRRVGELVRSAALQLQEELQNGIKSEMQNEVGEHRDEHNKLDREDSSHGQAISSVEAASAATADKATQLCLDSKYLQHFFGSSSRKNVPESEKDLAPAESLARDAKLDDASLERLEKTALEYWKKTYLIFAILA